MEKTDLKVLFLDVGGVLLSNGWGHESRAAAAKEFNINYENSTGCTSLFLTCLRSVTLPWKNTLIRSSLTSRVNLQGRILKHLCLHNLLSCQVCCNGSSNGKEPARAFGSFQLNNEPKELNDYRIKKFKLHPLFDAFISSCEVGMRKPDPGIFKLAMGVALAAPEQCYYFDDRPMLVEAAARLGINAFHHRGFESSKSIMKNYKDPIKIV
jgi:putative hydrolase of the HAD superfamily